MAQNLQLLKRRIKTSKNIAQIAKALEMIAASKIKKAQVAAQNNKPYADRITQITGHVLDSIDKKSFVHPYLTDTEDGTHYMIAISPDRGLCGSLNTNIYKKLIELDSSKIKLITVGKKVGLFASKLSYELVASYPMGSTIPDYSIVYELKSQIDEAMKKEKVSKVDILYADFVSLFTQTPSVKNLLPLNLELLEGESSKKNNEENDTSIFEPNKEALLKDLLPYYLEIQLYNALIQAFTSEQAAQMVAMQNAKNNAFDIAEYINLVYNKSRQERITNEILDLANSSYL